MLFQVAVEVGLAGIVHWLTERQEPPLREWVEQVRLDTFKRPVELALLLEHVRPDRRLLVEFLASTGLRVSEALGLDWPDLDLGDRAQVKVRAQRYRTSERVALKSAYARREVPLTAAMADALRELRPNDPRAAEGPVFADRRGQPIAYTTLHHRVWVPAREAAALDWAGLHALRHTCASLLIVERRSPVQIAAWLGHHSPAFSMAVYGHLMDDGVGEGLHLAPPVVAA